jgi:hypothetical protein
MMPVEEHTLFRGRLLHPVKSIVSVIIGTIVREEPTVTMATRP